MGYGKADGVDKGVISEHGSPRDNWLPGIGSEKGSGSTIQSSSRENQFSISPIFEAGASPQLT